jgi:hypothetical protein
MTTTFTKTQRDKLARLGAEREQASTQSKHSRAELRRLHALITPLVVAAAEAGVPQQDVVALSNLSRETVRLIERDHGIVRTRGGSRGGSNKTKGER